MPTETADAFRGASYEIAEAIARFSSTAPPIRSERWRFGGGSSTCCPGASYRSWMAPDTCPGSTTRAGLRTTSAGSSPHSQARAVNASRPNGARAA